MKKLLKITLISLTCSFLLGDFNLRATTHSTQTRVLSEKLVSTNGSLSESDMLATSSSPNESKVLAEKALQQAGSPIKGVVSLKAMPESLALLEKITAFSMDVNNPYLAKDHVQFNFNNFSSTAAEETSPALDNSFTFDIYWNTIIANQNFKELVDFVKANKAELIEVYQSPYVLIDLFGSTKVYSKGSNITMKIKNIRSLDISDEALVAIKVTSAYPKGYDIIHFSFFEYEGIVMYKLRFAVKIKD